LTQKRKLLDLWVEGYSARLRPNLLIGRYQPAEANLEQTLQILRGQLEDKKLSWAITGGFAGDILTRHFRGEQLSFFAQEWPLDLTRRLKWLPSDRGPVTVLRKFSPVVDFNLETPRSQPVAHPLLVYAELIFQGPRAGTGDGKNCIRQISVVADFRKWNLKLSKRCEYWRVFAVKRAEGLL
jgi:hypothetical protein